MVRFEVNKDDDIRNYGMYEYYKNGSDLKCLGATNDLECIFEYDIADHFSKHQEFYQELGPKYNLWFIPYEGDNKYRLNINYIDRSHHGDIKTLPTKEQYDFMIGILRECQQYEHDYGKKTDVTATSTLFYDHQERKGTDLDKIIADIEESRDILFPRAKVKIKGVLFPWIKK